MKVCPNRKCPRRRFEERPKPDDNFCYKCGTELVEVDELPTCENCGKPLRPGGEFCPNCGKKVKR